MFRTSLAVAVFALAAAPAMAQEATDPPTDTATVFDGDWLNIGVGGFYSPSYDGSDDYVFSVVPLIQGKVGGVSINPRPAGLALDFIPDADDGVGFALGPTARVRSNRVSRIEDPVVAAAGKLKRAYEIGPSVGVSFPKVLNPYDRLSFGVDALWDVGGAHKGMTVVPSVSYFTPLSRGIGAIVSVSAEHGDDDFMDYYYSVTPVQSVASGLPAYTAQSGWTKAGVTLVTAFDFDGDLTNGGLSAVAIGGYSRMLDQARQSPYTRLRGSADQFFVGGGLGYTF